MGHYLEVRYGFTLVLRLVVGFTLFLMIYRIRKSKDVNE